MDTYRRCSCGFQLISVPGWRGILEVGLAFAHVAWLLFLSILPIGGILVGIYLLVQFVKWAWDN